MFVKNYLDLVHHSSSLVVVHSVDKYSENVDHTFLVDFLVVDILADDLMLAAFHDTLEAQH